MFKVIKTDKKTKARLGVLTTPHGVVNTPSYVFVGTYGKFRHLNSNDIKDTNAQLIIANTFHLWEKAEKSKLKEGFIHKSFGLNVPIMTDSGGFQVLSLAFGDKNKVSKFMADDTSADITHERTRIRITSKGVHFKYNLPAGRQATRKWLFLGPELSMKLQSKIGADIMFAFDHITSPHDNFEYNKKAVELTDKWAQICLEEHAKNQKDRKHKQMLFGIVQGGIYPKLREKSAKFIGSLPFDGFGIGGSYTKKQISEILKWVIPYLPEEKPRHLLGVGKIADIFEAVENGIDTFDCVIPTREARHGKLYIKTGYIDIRKGRYALDRKKIESACKCLTCTSNITRAQIRGLIKSDNRKLNAAGQRWCLLHNMWFFNKLLEDIRNSIAKDKFLEFRKNTLSRLG
jgi:queuine tRNA-ribosyltransferase